MRRQNTTARAETAGSPTAPTGTETKRTAVLHPLRRPAVSRTIAAVHGVYYTATGAWPLLHLGSFYAVTGPKNDDWLVQTVGALVLAIGLTLLLAALRRRVATTARQLGLLSALAFLVVDVTFYLQGAIPVIYLADAFAELLLVAAWATVWLNARKTSPGCAT